MATTRLFFVLVPGALLLAVGAALANPWPFLAGVLAVCGLLLLVAWPALCIVVEIRTSRRRKRGLDNSPRLTAAQRAIAAIQAVTMLILLPTIVLGGLAAYCLLRPTRTPARACSRSPWAPARCCWPQCRCCFSLTDARPSCSVLPVSGWPCSVPAGSELQRSATATGRRWGRTGDAGGGPGDDLRRCLAGRHRPEPVAARLRCHAAAGCGPKQQHATWPGA